MDVVQQSTKSFIEEAIRNVAGVSDVRTIDSSAAVASDVNEDGRAVSITNVVIGLDQRQPASAGSATEVPTTGSTLKLKSIEFTFLVYADRSIEIRASLPDRFVFSLPDAVLQRDKSDMRRDNDQAIFVDPAITLLDQYEIPMLRGVQDVNGVSSTPVTTQASQPLRAFHAPIDDVSQLRRFSTIGSHDGTLVNPIANALTTPVDSETSRSAVDGMLYIRLGDKPAEQGSTRPVIELARSVDLEFSLQRYARHEYPRDKAGVLPVPADMIGLRIDVASRIMKDAPALARNPTALFQIFITSAPQPRSDSIPESSIISVGFDRTKANDQVETSHGREPFLAIGLGCVIWFTLSHRSRPCTSLARARSLPGSSSSVMSSSSVVRPCHPWYFSLSVLTHLCRWNKSLVPPRD